MVKSALKIRLDSEPDLISVIGPDISFPGRGRGVISSMKHWRKKLSVKTPDYACGHGDSNCRRNCPASLTFQNCENFSGGNSRVLFQGWTRSRVFAFRFHAGGSRGCRKRTSPAGASSLEKPPSPFPPRLYDSSVSKLTKRVVSYAKHRRASSFATKNFSRAIFYGATSLSTFNP